jgi:hypothetical protein
MDTTPSFGHPSSKRRGFISNNHFNNTIFLVSANRPAFDKKNYKVVE